MKTKFILGTLLIVLGAFAGSAPAQDLGPHFKQVKPGIYVYAAVPGEANSTIIRTQEGVVLIDTGQSPKDSHVVAAAVKKLTSDPVRLLATHGRPTSPVRRSLVPRDEASLARG